MLAFKPKILIMVLKKCSKLRKLLFLCTINDNNYETYSLICLEHIHISLRVVLIINLTNTQLLNTLFKIYHQSERIP